MSTYSPVQLLQQLVPLSRTLVHDDNAIALQLIKQALPNCKIESYPSGMKVWTWRVPNKWRVNAATIRRSDTQEILWDGMSHPLAVVNYSLPYKGKIAAAALESHLFSLPNRPEAIPFIYRFYDRDWGFCVTQRAKKEILSHSVLEVEINTTEQPGELLVGECFLAGEYAQEILIVSNICHPGIANDSISGAVAAVEVARYLASKNYRKYSYRFLFLPETIGSIAYLSQHPEVIQKAVGGLFTEMLGNDNSHCLQLSRRGDTYFDQVAKNVLSDYGKEYRIAKFLESAANDEKVLDSPGVNIPTISLTRYPYPEYHSSDDNVDLINHDLLNESCQIMKSLVDRMEQDYVPIYVQRGPVCLSEHGLYPNWYKDETLKPKWDAFLQIMYSLDSGKSCEQLASELHVPLEVIHYWTEAFHAKTFLEKQPFVMTK